MTKETIMPEVLIGKFDHGIEVVLPTDGRKKKTYRFPVGDFEDKEFIAVAKAALIIAGDKEEPAPTPKKTIANPSAKSSRTVPTTKTIDLKYCKERCENDICNCAYSTGDEPNKDCPQLKE